MIRRGLSDLRGEPGQLIGRIRRPGDGRKLKTETELRLLDALKDLVQSAIRGDPGVVLLWVSKSQRFGVTTTGTGLDLQCRLDENKYTKGLKVSDRKLAAINLEHGNFRSEWNYTISSTLSEPVTYSPACPPQTYLA